MSITFWLALLLVPAVSDEKQDAVRYLQTLQLPSGAFATRMPTDGSEPVPSLRSTRTAIRAFRLLGSDVPHHDAILKFLKDCYSSPTGGFADRPGVKPDPVSTSVALMILLELKQPVEPYLKPALTFMADNTQNFEEIRMVASGLEETNQKLPVVEKWGQIIDEARNADGTYGKGPGQARSTALRVVARQRLGLPVTGEDAVLKVIRAGQREDGGFGSDNPGESDQESCYRIVRLFSRLNAQPDRPKALRDFIQSCHNADGGYGVRPKEPSSLHGTYYATIIRYWL